MVSLLFNFYFDYKMEVSFMNDIRVCVKQTCESGCLDGGFSLSNKLGHGLNIDDYKAQRFL